jgi:putative nucleotidyltransferase with HDIG domain
MTIAEKQRRTKDRIARRLEELPLLPAVVAEIASMDPDSPEFVQQVEDLARTDPPFALRLLKMANGGSRPPENPILTIPQSIMRIGARPLASTITSMAVMRVFVPTTKGQKNLWNHALQVAECAREIAAQQPELNTKPEVAYLAGLLHDVGRFVMFDESPKELGAVDESGWTNADQLVAAELEICGYDHATLGAMACESWRLPLPVTQMIRDHHVYDGRRTDVWEPEMERLIRIVQTADCLSFLLMSNPGFLKLDHDTRRDLIRKACVHKTWGLNTITPDRLERSTDDIASKSNHWAQHLGVSLAPHH